MLLTDEQIQAIRQIIDDHHTAFIVNAVDPKVVSQEVLDDLTRKGLINTKVQSVQDAYLYGQALAAAQNPAVANMSLPEFKAYLRKNPVPLTATEQQAVTVAQQQTAQYIRGLGNRVNTQTGQVLIEADQQLRRRMRDTIRSKVEANVAARETVKQLKSDIGWATKDWTRDLDRISTTEKHDAMEHGQADSMAKRYGADVRVAKVAHPDCCPQCRRLYVGPDGAPRIFRLADLEGNGSNVGRRAADWMPVVGPTHPHCVCTLTRVPAGFGFDSAGDLVPGGQLGLEYDPSTLQASLAQERTLHKALQTRHSLIDFQQIPITVENPAGSTRQWTAVDGTAGQTTMRHAYGYLQGTHGHDNEEIDCYVGPNPLTRRAFIIHQIRPDGLFDEDKIMLGFSSEQEARAAYAAHRDDGEACIGGVQAMSMQAFKRWLAVHSHAAAAAPLKKAAPPKQIFVANTFGPGELSGRLPAADGNPRLRGVSGAALLFNPPARRPSGRAQDMVGDLPMRRLVDDRMAQDTAEGRAFDRDAFDFSQEATPAMPKYHDVAAFARGPASGRPEPDRAAIARRIERLDARPDNVEAAPPPGPRLLMQVVGLKKARRRPVTRGVLGR